MDNVTTKNIHKLFLPVFAALIFSTIAPNLFANESAKENHDLAFFFDYGTNFGSGFFDNCYSLECEAEQNCQNYVNNPNNTPESYEIWKQNMTNTYGIDYNVICADINYSGGTA